MKRAIKPFLWALLTFILICLTYATYWTRQVIKETPHITREALISTPSSNIYAKNGDIIWSSQDNFRLYVEYSDIPQSFIDLVLSTEDYEFYQNPGFNPKGLINAGISYISNQLGFNTPIRGGSSIEQQLVKLSVFSTEAKDQTIERKIKEFFLANQLSENYSKNDILTYYLNKIYLGEGAYGIQTISQIYYGKPLKELSLAQQAILAGLGQAPSEYNLYDNPEGVKTRRNTVLRLAYERGLIPLEIYQEAKNTPIDKGLKPRNWMQDAYYRQTTYYASYVDSVLDQVKALGYDLEALPLQIHTPLDPKTHQFLKETWDDPDSPYFQDQNQQAAITVTDPETGDVLAQLGGRFIKEPFGFNRATTTNRSSGSSIKPFVAVVALDTLGWNMDTLINSNNFTYQETGQIASNYGGVEYGNVPLDTALNASHNTPFLRILEASGIQAYLNLLTNLNVVSPNTPLDLTHALGVDTSTSKLVGAVSALSQEGEYHPNRYVSKITFPDGSTKSITLPSAYSMRPETAYSITRTLQKVTQPGGMFQKAQIENLPIAVKTGTVAYDDTSGFNPQNDAMDMWFFGYTKHLALAIWLGYDQPFEEGQQLHEDVMYTKKAELFKHIVSNLITDKDYEDWEYPNQTGEGETLSPFIINFQPDLYPLYLGVEELTYNHQNLHPDFEQIPSDYTYRDWVKEYERQEDLELQAAIERLRKNILIEEEEKLYETTPSLRERFGLPKLGQDDLLWKNATP